jgi:uncharacterized protein (DUF488 family)
MKKSHCWQMLSGRLDQPLPSAVLMPEGWRPRILRHAVEYTLATMSSPTNHLYTIGYEGMDISAFINRLIDAGVQTIVDVRELPLSRKKGFSKTAFRQALAESGIAYFHVPALGCPKDVRDQYKVDRDWAVYTKSFLAYVETQDATVRELVKLSKATKACLVCFEAEFTLCHRTYVARAARKLGGPTVMHLTAKTVQADSGLRAVA